MSFQLWYCSTLVLGVISLVTLLLIKKKIKLSTKSFIFLLIVSVVLLSSFFAINIPGVMFPPLIAVMAFVFSPFICVFSIVSWIVVLLIQWLKEKAVSNRKKTISRLIEQATTGKYYAHGQVEKGECVIAFAFGFREENGLMTPGESNYYLADLIAEGYADQFLILQQEITAALAGDIGEKVFTISEHGQDPSLYLDSYEVAKQAKELMDYFQLKKAIIIAHPYHLPRVDLICQKIGIETIVPTGLEKVPFDEKSAQEWTRNATSWGQREKWVIEESIRRDLI